MHCQWRAASGLERARRTGAGIPFPRYFTGNRDQQLMDMNVKLERQAKALLAAAAKAAAVAELEVEDGVFEVDRVVNERRTLPRRTESGMEFECSWIGFPLKADNTWQSQESLEEFAHYAIYEFQRLKDLMDKAVAADMNPMLIYTGDTCAQLRREIVHGHADGPRCANYQVRLPRPPSAL